MVGQVLDAVIVGDAPDREHAEPIRGQLIEHPIGEQCVMTAFVAELHQAVLPNAHQPERRQRHGDIPRPSQSPAFSALIEDDRQSKSHCQQQIFSGNKKPIGHIVWVPQRIDVALDIRIV